MGTGVVNLNLFLELLIELNLAHDTMKNDVLGRIEPNITFKVLLLDNQKYYTCIVAQDIFPIKWIYTNHIFYKTASYKKMLVYGIR